MRAKPDSVFMQSHLGWYWTCLEGGEYVYDHTNMNRTTSYTLPSSLELLTQIPQQIKPKWDLDLRKLVDSAALTHQALYRMNSHAAKF